MKVAVITPTSGKRPEMMALCRKYFERQTLRADMWLIGNESDGSLPAPKKSLEERKLRKRRVWEVYRLLMRRAVAQGATHILVMEDDDWYSPTYIETRVKQLESTPCVTGDCCWSWHVEKQAYAYTDAPGLDHVFQIAFRNDLVPWLVKQDLMTSLRRVCVQMEPVVAIKLEGYPNQNPLAKPVEDIIWTPDPEATMLRRFMPEEELAPYLR